MARILLGLAILVAVLGGGAGATTVLARSTTWTCPTTDISAFPRTIASAGCAFTSTAKTSRTVCVATDRWADKLAVRVTLIHADSGTTLAVCATPRDARKVTATTSKSRTRPPAWTGTSDPWTLRVRVEMLDARGNVTRTVEAEITVPAGFPVYL